MSDIRVIGNVGGGGYTEQASVLHRRNSTYVDEQCREGEHDTVHHRNNTGEIKGIRFLGNIGVGGQKGDVFDPGGLCSSETATQYKDAHKIIDIIYLGNANDLIIKKGQCE